MITCQTEFGNIKTIFLKKPVDAFIRQKYIEQQWKQLNYLSAPHYERACAEYDAFTGFFIEAGIEIKYFAQNDRVGLDSIYCRDASIATDHGVILCNMGKIERNSEPDAAKEIYNEYGVQILGKIEPPGRIEGGDVAWLDEKTLAVGHGYRSNDEGFRQLSRLLAPYNIDLIQVDLPHFKGTNDVFHLMSIFSPIDQNLAVVYSALIPVRFRNVLLDKGFSLVEVPKEEFESMGCNVLAISPRNCIAVDGNPVAKEGMLAMGCEVEIYKGREISLKGGGGPTCLTRPLWREI